MGKKKDKKKLGLGAEKTAMKTEKKAALKLKKTLQKLGEEDISDLVVKLEAKEAALTTTTETTISSPTPRSSFSFISHPTKEELILFGGEYYDGQNTFVYNELYFYNIRKNEWKQVSAPGGPPPRSAHQMVSVGIDGGQLWVFGGEHASKSQLQFHHYNDLWVFRLNVNKWEKVKAPHGPSPRCGHRMVTSKKRLFVFGGFRDNSQQFEYFNDVHIFSLETYQWVKIKLEGITVPSPRSGCCMAPCPDGSILIWGGYSRATEKKGGERGVTLTDMYKLTQDARNDKIFHWSTVKTRGSKLPPYSSVGYTFTANGKAYCFGGVCDDEDEDDIRGQFDNTLYSLDLSSLKLNSLDIQSGNRATKDDSDIEEDVDQDNKLNENQNQSSVSEDGVFTMTVERPSNTSTSSNPTTIADQQSPSQPSPRMKPGICVNKGTLFIYGGIFESGNRQYSLNDFYSINLRKMDKWKEIISNSSDTQAWYGSESESDSDDSDQSDSESDDSDEDDCSEMDTD